MASEGWRVILAGSGGQGVGVGGRILALAAVLEGLNATHSQSYGACARGGPSRSEVIIGGGEIEYPLVEEADVLVALTGPAYLENVALLAPEGLLICDTDAVPAGDGRGLGLPLVATARALRHERGVTVVALGVLVRRTGLVTPESAVAAVNKVFSGELAACNERLLRAGMELVAGDARRGP